MKEAGPGQAVLAAFLILMGIGIAYYEQIAGLLVVIIGVRLALRFWRGKE